MAYQGRYPIEQVGAPLHESLLGESAGIREVREVIQRLSGTGLTVLITGESGTGKDIVARMLHRYSPRGDKTFIKVNCPAIPESILESELFGYERGAFTGARASKPGRLELAHTGTIFLDEVAETSVAVQGKLLQLLDGEPIMRIGGVTPIQCDVRVLAATNMNLDNAVRDGRMREDMLFRLSEVLIHIPPLRERRQDIPLLAEHFNYNYLAKLGREYSPIEPEHLAKMSTLSWRGNVRELSACVRRYVATADPDALWGEEEPETGHRGASVVIASSPVRAAAAVESAPVAPVRTRPALERSASRFPLLKEAVQRAVEETERTLIEEALRHTLWNRRKAARLLGVSYSSLLRRIDAYQIGKTEA